MKNRLKAPTVQAWTNPMVKPIRISVSAAILTALLATGCASTAPGSKDDILPTDLPTMEQIYEAHSQHKPIPRRKTPEPAKQDQGSQNENDGAMEYTSNGARNMGAHVRKEPKYAKPAQPGKPAELIEAEADGEDTNVSPPKGGRLIRTVQTGNADLVGYTREASNELDNTFRLLPNPVLVMYIFPHLSGAEGTPVPGYTTKFSMYDKPEFALPGEVASQ